MSANPIRKPAYRAHEMPGRLGIGKILFYELRAEGVIPEPAGFGPRAKTWTDEQVEALFEALRQKR